MSPVPAFETGVWNAWIFMSVFVLQYMGVLLVPGPVAERTSHAPEIIRNRQDRIMALLANGSWIGATLYSIFLPLRVGTGWFYPGLALFIIGVIVLVSTSLSVFRTPVNEPFTGGIYRFSRHPIYLSMIFVYAGVSIAAASWLFLVITIITFFLQRYQLLKEERYCCGKFGASYHTYMERTPRWIGIPKPG